MHPIEDIRGSKSDCLAGKRIVLGITGSIAAVECVKLARELARHGAIVIPVMSEAAVSIVHPDSIHFATGNPPILKLDGAVKHVELCGNSGGRADALLIAPATANTISKMAMGIDDTVVTTMASCAFGSGMPIVVVPAMHSSMYDHGIVTDNIKKLRKLGVTFVGPTMDENKAKMASTDEVVASVLRVLGPADYEGKRVIVITGSTRERIDDVRYIGNGASGRTGVELGLEAHRRGADVEVWAPADVVVPGFLARREFTDVESLAKMTGKSSADLYLVPAAISDFTVKARKGKISSGDIPELKLGKARRILESLRAKKNAVVVGFKAESGVSGSELVKRATIRMRENGLDLIVANLIEDVDLDNTKATLIRPGKKEVPFKGRKSELAKLIFDTLSGD